MIPTPFLALKMLTSGPRGLDNWPVFNSLVPKLSDQVDMQSSLDCYFFGGMFINFVCYNESAFPLWN